MAAVGTVTYTALNLGGGVTKYTWAWTSDGSGAVSGQPKSVKRGYLMQAKFVPSSVTAPTTLYDATLVDTDGFDMLDGNGANLSATAASMVLFDPRRYHDGTQQLDLVVANAGSAKLGTLILYVQL